MSIREDEHGLFRLPPANDQPLLTARQQMTAALVMLANIESHVDAGEKRKYVNQTRIHLEQATIALNAIENECLAVLPDTSPSVFEG